MSDVAIPSQEWKQFLEAFTDRHRGSLVRMEIHDLETDEEVGWREMRLYRLEFDTEDTKNPRINVALEMDHKMIKHVLFRPSQLTLHLSADTADEWLRIQSLNTTTTVRFRAALQSNLVA